MDPKILESESYRDFIRQWMESRSRTGKAMTYASLARSCGFSSRGYVRDVVLGTKRITLTSLPAFVHGLGLKGALAEFFQLLVAAEHADCRPRPMSSASLEKKIASLRMRLGRRNQVDLSTADSAFADFNIPRIYAALGHPDRGDSCAKIAERAGLSAGVVLQALATMKERGWVLEEKGRFRAKQDAVLFSEQKARSEFQRFYLDLQARGARAAKLSFGNPEQLFFGSCLSVRSSDLPRLRDELSQVLGRFVERAENSEGDRVVSLAATLFK